MSSLDAFKDYKGMSNIVTMEAVQNEKGEWHVVHTISYSRSNDLEKWEDWSVKMEATDKDLESALAEALLSLAAYLDAHDPFEEMKEDNQELLN
jgi:hypothetical protein